jgi:hypothetical protein
MHVNKFNTWQKLNEQEEKKDKKTVKNMANLEDSLGVTEEEFLAAFTEKINVDTGKKRNLMGKIKNESIKSGIVETFLHSKKTHKDFFRDSTKFKFVTGVAEGGKTNLAFASQDDDKNIPYMNVSGEFKKVPYARILDDINSMNADLYSTKGEKSQYVLVKIKDSKKANGVPYYLKAKKSVGGGGLFVIAEGKFSPRTNSTSTKDASTTTHKAGKAGSKFTFDIKLDTNKSAGSGVTFETGSAEVVGDATSVIFNKLQEQAKQQGVTDLSTIEITKFTIISSASNHWEGKLAATHNNAGAPTNISHDTKIEDNPGWKVENANKNYVLAQNRGKELGGILHTGLVAKGIAKIAQPTSSPRITDTGGVNDDQSSMPNPGQYARLIIEAKAIGEGIIDPIPGTDKTITWFTQFKLKMVNFEGAGKGLQRIRSLSLDKAKYLKKGGGWKSPRYIKRHGGGNRPPSGLAPWFDNIFHGGI